MVKSEHLEAAKELFEGTGINVTENGKRYLGAVMEGFVREKVVDWVKDVKNLSVIAEFQPQAAYAVFTHSLVSSWNYIMRTIPNIDSLLQPLEDAIRHVFLPALIGRQSFSEGKGSCLHCLPDLEVLELQYQRSVPSVSSALRQSCQIPWCPSSMKESTATWRQLALNGDKLRLHFACRTAPQPKRRPMI